MSQADDRRAEATADERDAERAMNERQAEPTAPFVRDRRSWASECAGWRIGIHERTKESRDAGIYKCKWCAQIFDPPTEAERALMKSGALGIQRISRPSRWKR